MPFQFGVPTLALMAGFVVVALVFSALTMGSGGWRAAAGRFGTSAQMPESAERFRFASIALSGGVLGLGTYKNIVTVGLSEAGIWLSLWGPFALGHRPLLIPWDEVAECRDVPAAWGKRALVILRDGDGFQAIGAPAEALLEWWAGGGAVQR